MPEFAVLCWAGIPPDVVFRSLGYVKLTCPSTGLTGRRGKLIAWLAAGRLSPGLSVDVRDSHARAILAEIRFLHNALAHSFLNSFSRSCGRLAKDYTFMVFEQVAVESATRPQGAGWDPKLSNTEENNKQTQKQHDPQNQEQHKKTVQNIQNGDQEGSRRARKTPQGIGKRAHNRPRFLSNVTRPGTRIFTRASARV